MNDVKYEPVSREEFDELFTRCSNWHRWGDRDQRGALNYIEPVHVARAAALIREGISISCSRDLDTVTAVDNPSRALHYMVKLPTEDSAGSRRTSAALDFLGLECHGEVHSHLDALCHIAYEGRLYNDWPVSTVGVEGADVLNLSVVTGGITSRGVLLDIAALHGKPWLDEGYAVGQDELGAAEMKAGVTVGTGDVVLVRTGQSARRKVEGPWDSATSKSGLHPRAMPWFKDREVAAIGFDGDGDVEPHLTEGIRVPIHVLGITAMGLHFFDCLDLDELSEQCAALQRWEMFFVAAPLRLLKGTGCAVNPIAMM